MKKSRIIIPALAVMALSMGAAVTSTVAWFTANRNASATSSPISIINPEGNLKVTGQDGYGTTLAGTGNDNANKATIEHAKDFRDGSVNILTGKVYTSNLNSNGDGLDSSKPYREVTLDQDLTGKDHGYLDGKSFAAQTYKLKFDFGDSTTKPGKYGLFFDGAVEKSVITTSDSAEGSNNIAKALRVGFVCGEQKLVFAPSANETLGRSHTYVKDETTAVLPTYLDANIAKEARTSTYAAAGNTLDNFLGDFDIAETPATKSLTVTVWVWIEGSDETNVNNDATLPNDLAFNLAFNVVTYTGA